MWETENNEGISHENWDWWYSTSTKWSIDGQRVKKITNKMSNNKLTN